MTLEILEEYNMGWYLFELVVRDGMWERAHGLVYPDGTVRDPSIISALMGFYRNRGASAVRSDVNQEDYVTELIRRVSNLMAATRRSNSSDPAKDLEDSLELCEYAANILEAGELVPMAYPPTAKAAAYRRRKDTDIDEVKDWLYEMVSILKRACRIV